MPRLTRQWIDRQRHLADNTWVAETASGVIVISHPSQKPPDPKDRKFLRENFGLLNDVEIKPLSETVHAPDFERLERELALQDMSLDDRIAHHKQELVRLLAEKAAITGQPLPLPGNLETAVVDDALREAGEAHSGDEEDDVQRPTAAAGAGRRGGRTARE